MLRREFLAGLLPTVFLFQLNLRIFRRTWGRSKPKNLQIVNVGATSVTISFE